MSNKKDKLESGSQVNFSEKIKDSRYKAKLELGFYAILILVIIICFGSGSLENGNSTDSNVISPGDDDRETVEEVVEKMSYYEMLDYSNFSYEIKGEENLTFVYTGKADAEKVSINRDGEEYYYGEGMFYQSNGEEKTVVEESVIFDKLKYNFLNIVDLKEYIKLGSTDNVITRSNGDKKTYYSINLRDIIQDNHTEDILSVEVLEEGEKVVVTLLANSLYKDDYDTCTIEIIYTDIKMPIVSEDTSESETTS